MLILLVRRSCVLKILAAYKYVVRTVHYIPCILQQFLYVELTSMAKELQELSSLKPARSCRDVQLEKPDVSSGTFTVDPNVGSSLDSVKAYCHFEGEQATTCVQNSTTFSQINHLHLLHTRASQTIQLPCSLKGPLRCVCVCVESGRMGRILMCVYSADILWFTQCFIAPTASLLSIVITVLMYLSQRRETLMLSCPNAIQ